MGQYTAKIRSVFSLIVIFSILHHLFVYFVSTRDNGLNETASSYDSIKVANCVRVFFEFFAYCFVTEFVLIPDPLERCKFFSTVSDGKLEHFVVALEKANLVGSATWINRQNVKRIAHLYLRNIL